MTVRVEKSGKILENFDADQENADVCDTGDYGCTFLHFMRLTI